MLSTSMVPCRGLELAAIRYPYIEEQQVSADEVLLRLLSCTSGSYSRGYTGMNMFYVVRSRMVKVEMARAFERVVVSTENVEVGLREKPEAARCPRRSRRCKSRKKVAGATTKAESRRPVEQNKSFGSRDMTSRVESSAPRSRATRWHKCKRRPCHPDSRPGHSTD